MEEKRKCFYLRVITAALALIMLVGAASAFASCASVGDGSGNYIKVVSKGRKLEMRVSVSEYDLKEAFLFAVDPWQSASELDGLTPIAKGKVNNGVAQAKFDIVGDTAEAVTKGYVFGKPQEDGYVAISGVYYVSNPRDLHGKVKSKEDAGLGMLKGAIGSTSGLLDLGAKSTVVTVDIGKLLTAKGGIGSIRRVWNGYSFYVDRNELERLDQTIKGYSDSGIRVFLEIVQTTAYSFLPEGVRSIAYSGVGGAEGYALNMNDREGVVRICGIFDLLAERYGTENGFGVAESFIIGRNVNDFRKYYAGAATLERSAQNYIAAVRAAYSILLAHTPNGRVYISIDNNWNVANYNAKEFLSTISNISREGGDFYWQVAIEANASDASLSSIWTDGMVSDSSEFLSPANINVLSSLLSSGQYTCNGMKRNMLLNRFVIGGSDEEARAASYAYAYYKCLETECVDSLIYGRVSDTADDVILGGLLTGDIGGNMSERKLIADIFASIDNRSDANVEEIGKQIGSAWDVIYKENRSKAIRRTVFSSGDTGEHSGKNLKIQTIFSGGDLYGFVPASSTDYIGLRYSSLWQRPVLYAELSPESASDGAGIVSNSIKLKDIKDAGYLGVVAMVSASKSDLVNITVRLSGYTKNGTEKVLVCNSRAESGSWFELYYDVADFIKDIKSEDITLAVIASSCESGGEVESLWLSEIKTESPIRTGMPVWLIVVLIVLAVGGALAGFIIWFTKNYTFVRE